MLKIIICLALVSVLTAARIQDKADSVLVDSICAKYPSLCNRKLEVEQQQSLATANQELDQNEDQLLDQAMSQDAAVQMNEALADANRDQNEVAETARSRRSGVVFTRWGNKGCPRRTQLVYSGITGGTHYNNRGGASNYLCMPPEPQYTLKTRAGVQGHSYVYGSEYELPLQGVQNHNAPCAVCLASSRQTTLMVPGHTKCPERWNIEYKGYLMSEHIGHHRTEFICVDEAQQSLPGSYADLNGILLYHTEAHCSGMPCPPYNPAKELTCVVCSI